MRNLGCIIGLHSYRSSGNLKVRSRFHKCRMELYKNERHVHTPMKKCADCGKEVADRGVIVFSSIEAPNPFYTMPYFDCQCGMGNEKHREEYTASMKKCREQLSKNIRGIF